MKSLVRTDGGGWGKIKTQSGMNARLGSKIRGLPYQPFTAPKVSPRMIYRCMNQAIIKVGKIAIAIAAAIGPHRGV